MVELSRGRRDVELVRSVAPWLDAERESRRLEERELVELDGIGEVPGARRLLEGLPADCWVRDLTEVVPDPPARGRTASDGLVLAIGASVRA